MNNIKNVHVLNHTHWDREWYETFEEFRLKLRDGLRYVNKLIDEEKIDKFFLDGQTVALDDYKEVVSSEEYEKIAKLIKNGKIEIGPWYVLADEFLISGESIIKNLELGIDISKELGSKYDIGYLPDTFGHISQMPQILKSFDINNAIVWRGAISDSFENNWISPDGSKVLTFVLPLFGGYYQTYLKADDYVEKFEEYMEDNRPYLKNENLLVMNGADHTYTSDNLKVRLNDIGKKHDKLNIVQSVMSDYVKEFKGYEPENNLYGEQRDPRKIFVLPGVYSTRMYLKEGNQRCEDEAVNVMETVNVWSNNKTDSKEFMKYIWKTIVKNHAHDSICGCSIDEVHDEMETRYKKVLQAINQFAKLTLDKEYNFEFINQNVLNDKLYIVNNNPFKDSYKVKTSILINKDMDKGSIKLLNGEEEVNIDIINKELREELLREITKEPFYAEYYIYDIEFMMEFDGFETKKLDIVLAKESVDILQNNEENYIENEYYKVSVNDNSLTILDKTSGEEYDNMHKIVSTLDAGDTYNYSPPVNDCLSKATIKSINKTKKGNSFESITINYEIETPKELNKQRTGPSEELVKSYIEATITLRNNSKLIEFDSEINNNAKDQKLKVAFNVDKCDKTYGDTAFDIIERKTLRDRIFDVDKNKELESNEYPTLSTVIANDLQLVHRGMQEYQVEKIEDKDYVMLTALRCVGDLSRRDLRTRGAGAGPGYKTPGAQCIGTYKFSYGLVIGEENFNMNHSKHIRNRVLVAQSYINKDNKKLFSINNKDIAFSSVTQNQDDSFEIRVFNYKEESQNMAIALGIDAKSAQLINLSKKSIKDLDIINNNITIDVEPKKIATIRIKY
ncbi:glycoside hydrolase family 38 C-terminal domain-containing protein [Clostridium sp.]|uniref:glycoside hydrolase family 38 N-terminal domain-containing protein n=1 Tax=Clostridium sp. TaxID=1506 RepID=UPI003F3A49BF